MTSDLNDTSRALTEAIAQAYPEGRLTAEQTAELLASCRDDNTVSPPRRDTIPMADLERPVDGVVLFGTSFRADTSATDLRVTVAVLRADAQAGDSDG